jgi:hypothetical protein
VRRGSGGWVVLSSRFSVVGGYGSHLVWECWEKMRDAKKSNDRDESEHDNCWIVVLMAML